MTLLDYKLEVFRELMHIENENAIKQIHAFVHNFYSELQNNTEFTNTASETVSFEEWNKQFTDDKNLDTFLPEHDLTLRELRRQIYNAEMSAEMSMQEFKQSLKSW